MPRYIPLIPRFVQLLYEMTERYWFNVLQCYCAIVPTWVSEPESLPVEENTWGNASSYGVALESASRR